MRLSNFGNNKTLVVFANNMICNINLKLLN